MKELRTKRLDDVCLDCMDNISPKDKMDCDSCVIAKLKKRQNKILNDRFNKEMPH